MKSQVALWNSVAQDMGHQCRTCTTRDEETVSRRVEDEGLSFLTITLPAFGKAFEQALEAGSLRPSMVPGFRFHRGLPAFLRGFLGQIFDPVDGTLRPYPSVDCVFAVRQLCQLMAKLEVPCTKEREDAAFAAYVACEKEVEANHAVWTHEDYMEFSQMADRLFGDVFSDLELLVRDLDITPKHGPGSTAGGLRGNAKFSDWTWTERLDEVLPWGDFLLPSWRFRKDVSVNFLEPGAEPPVKVITVPKTLKTPRIIAMEPVHMQYAQQALLQGFLEALNGKLASNFLGFDDEVPNQHLARRGSIDGSLATLDLSEASDRVSVRLVNAMLHDYPFVRAAVMAARSTTADVPNHGVITLAKYASMGSALTFPLEACVFLTCVFLGIQSRLSVPLDRRRVRALVGSVRIFGDDIIVPREYVQDVTTQLERFGAKVNVHKSFWNGKFRESCGGDYYGGADVSIIRQRRELPTSRLDVADVVGTVAFRNLLSKDGRFPATVEFLDGRIGKVLPHYPVVHPTSPALGRHREDFYQVDRMCPTLHRPLTRGYVVRSVQPINPVDGVAALTKFFIRRGFEPYEQGHLERSGRPDAVGIKLRWTTPY